MFLLDANVLIRAHEDYYPIDRVPPFWEWLVRKGNEGLVKMPFEIHDEIAVSNGMLKDWIVQRDVIDALVLDDEVDDMIFNRVLNEGYGENLTDTELEEIGRDPFLISYAIMKPGSCVVTKETSKPSKKRANRRIPDVCSQFSIQCMNDFGLYKALDFRVIVK